MKLAFSLLIVVSLFSLFGCEKPKIIPSVASYSFNDNKIKEVSNKETVIFQNVNLVEDRFGNAKSAVYTSGNAMSYLNLGKSTLLKPKEGSCSIWVNLIAPSYSGKGIAINPFIGTKSHSGNDFYEAYFLYFDRNTKRVAFTSCVDSLNTVTLISEDTLSFNKWAHYVITWSDKETALFINGVLNSKSKRGFSTNYLQGDSVVVGITANEKNARYSVAYVDDISFYNKPLNASQVIELYTQPNPNVFFIYLSQIWKYLLLSVIITSILIGSNQIQKRKDKKQKEKADLEKKILELEMKIIKAQLNPHFVSNCLSAIQNFIFKLESEQASQYLSKFSLLFRMVLQMAEKNLITVSDELEMMQLYVELESLRFNNEITFDCQIDKESMDKYIPSMITQPIIENAFIHGLAPIRNLRIPELKIKIFNNNNIINIKIEDNGKGFVESYNTDKNRVSYGLKLVETRITYLNKLIDPEFCSFRIIPNDDGKSGTIVILSFDNNKLDV